MVTHSCDIQHDRKTCYYGQYHVAATCDSKAPGGDHGQQRLLEKFSQAHLNPLIQVAAIRDDDSNFNDGVLSRVEPWESTRTSKIALCWQRRRCPTGCSVQSFMAFQG
jgi:hypothetical protein